MGMGIHKIMKQIEKLIDIGKRPSWKMVVHDAELKALQVSICNTIQF